MKQRTSVIALVAALHVAAIWLLASMTVRIPLRAASESLPLLLLAPENAAGSNPVPRPSDRTDRAMGPNRRRSALEPSAAVPKALPQSDAIREPIDWEGVLNRAAVSAASAAAAPPPREFGFPRSAEPGAASAPEFAWSHARTHRLELLTGGGLLVNINDHCVLILFPLPFVGCGIGKIAVNGALFEHMRDPAQAGD